MNTQYLNYAIEVEKSGSITKAAQNLYMAQPNLSKAIKELEDQMGYGIFHRNARGMEVTRRGGIFLEHAKNIVAQVEQLEKISLHDERNMQAVHIAIPRGSYVAHGVTEFINALDHSKKMNISILETNSLEAINKVVDENYHLGIIRYRLNNETYWLDYLSSKPVEWEEVWSFEYMVVMSKNHPLADKEVITEEELEEYIELMHGDIMVPYVGNKESKEMHRRIYVYERASQYDMLVNVPGTFMLVSAIPDSYLERFGLVMKHCKMEGNQCKDISIRRKNYEFTEMDKLFLQKVHESRAEVDMYRV